jgi:hypothetical protein
MRLLISVQNLNKKVYFSGKNINFFCPDSDTYHLNLMYFCGVQSDIVDY